MKVPLHRQENILICSGNCLCCTRPTDDYKCSDPSLLGSVPPVSFLEVYEMALEQRGRPNMNALPPVVSWNDKVFEEEYPSLFAFLHDDRYSNGKPRKQGTISIFVKGDGLTFAINDHERAVVAFVNEGTWTEALFMIDEGIAKDTLAWKSPRTPIGGNKVPF